MASISRVRLAALTERETKHFIKEHAKSRPLFERARASLQGPQARIADLAFTN